MEEMEEGDNDDDDEDDDEGEGGGDDDDDDDEDDDKKSATKVGVFPRGSFSSRTRSRGPQGGNGPRGPKTAENLIELRASKVDDRSSKSYENSKIPGDIRGLLGTSGDPRGPPGDTEPSENPRTAPKTFEDPRRTVDEKSSKNRRIIDEDEDDEADGEEA